MDSVEYHHSLYLYPATEDKNQPRRHFKDPSLPSSPHEDVGQPSQPSFFNGTQVINHSVLNGATTHTNLVVPFSRANRQPQGRPSWLTSAAPLPLPDHISDPYNQHCALPNTTAPLAPCSNHTTLESVHAHGSHSQGYHGIELSHDSAATSLHSQQQPQFHVSAHPSFTSGNKAALTTHTNGAAGTPNYGPPLSSPMYAFRPEAPLVLVSPAATTTFSTSMSASPSLAIATSADTLKVANVDGRNGNILPLLSVRGADTTAASLLPLELEEIDEDPPPLPPPATPCPLLRKPKSQGSKVRKIMDDVPLERDIPKLQQRLRKQGGDEPAIARVPTVFKNGVSKNALRLRRRKMGGKSINFDEGYLNFVGRRQVKKTNETGEYYENEWWCRLCPPEDRISYVAFKNLQPHLCTKHFGLPGRGKTSGNV